MTQRIRGVLVSVGLIALVIILTASNQPLEAQVSTAALNGTVYDTSAAGVPGAQVSLESTTRKSSRQTVTDVTGAYVFTSLEPDSYQLVVTAKGFTTQTIQNIVLVSGQGSTLNVTMQLGASVTQLTVTEHAPLLETSTAAVGSTIGSTQLTTLPLLGRNFQTLMAILPGAMLPYATCCFDASPGGTGQAGGYESFYGQRPRDNEFTIDGMPDMELLFDAVPIYPPPESIAEMKVESGMDSGAYGWSAGANINLVTKSGTNAYHGDLLEYIRNSALNSRGFFDPNVARVRWNQFGGSAGGPLVIPHLVSKDKGWYVFGWYEGIRIPNKSAGYARVPSAQELAGDFSSDPAIYNPYTSVVSPDGTLLSRSPFPNNQIPTGSTTLCSPQPTCIDPSSLLIVTKLWPQANLPFGSGPGGTNYVGTTIGNNTYDSWNTRVDHQFGQKDSMFARYSDSRNPQTSTFFPNLPSITHARYTNIEGSETHTFSPSFLTTTRFGWIRFNDYNSTNGPDVATPAGTVAAFPSSVYNGLERVVPIAITDIGSLSQGFGYYGPDNLFVLTSDSQKVKGRHTVAFGGWYMHSHYLTNNQTGTQEQFNSLPTMGLASGTGYGLASYLLGLPSSSGRVIGSTEGDMVTNYYSLYVQDGFRATKKLTVNFGFRYDYAQPAVNVHGNGTFVWETGQYDCDKANPITSVCPTNPIGRIPPDYTNFAPRIGLAYQLTPKTTLRGSYGIFYDDFGETQQSQQGARGNWPYSFPQTIGSENSGLPQYYLQNPFPGPAAGSATPLGCQQCLEIYRANTRTPYVQEWSASVQRQLTPSLLWEINYFGSHGIRGASQIVDNTALTGGTDNYQNRQRWPQFPPYVNNGFNQNPSKYNGMSMELRKNYSHGLSYLVSYTWSKTMDTSDSLGVSTISPFVQPLRFNINSFWGPAQYDVTHLLRASYTWDIPGKTGNKLGDAALANWSFSGIYSYDSGPAYFVIFQADNANIGTVPGRADSWPDLVGNPRAISPTINEWFNTSAYQAPPFGTQGDAGKHDLYSDGMNNLDFALYKRWPFTETRNVEFRAEFFNGFNDHSFNQPGPFIDAPQSFGRISSVRQGGRQIQFALKLHF